MNPKLLRKTEIAAFVQSLAPSHTIVAPQPDEGQCSYGVLSNGAQPALDGGRPRKSAKEALYPQKERMFAFEAGAVEPCSVEPEPPLILFGVRACDLKGIEALDTVLLHGAFVDAFYKARREAAAIVGLACEKMCPTCFCNSFGIDPYAPPACDVNLVPAGDAFVAQPLTEKGEALVASLPDADAAHLATARKAGEAFHAAENPKVAVDAFVEAVAEVFESPAWEGIVDGCINCGGCTYVCPTCHCFDIVDETIGHRGQRVRAWDTCMAARFTLHTSGHNPRVTPAQRLRQRILHKFQYMKKNQSILGCTGCGRCVAVCPVNWDIRDAIGRLTEELSTASKA
ncbi:MAG: 4Fe-4S dicluster domain-containing protein [Candidatus Sumerlaeota bacterium]|nr:4Fe-4S dicluster domain-containing protein [Candidatus Sumerlaeota bacterium]